jgi:serine protease Do
LAKDEKTDLAILKADLKNTTVNEAQFGNSSIMRVGDWVLAIGNPFGLGGTVTAGIISARQRDIQSGPYDDYLQTDASINQGNSGGPMFNMDGQVIGINTAIFSPTGGSVGIGFAIPSDLVKPIIDQLQKYGRTRRGWLGVKIQDITEDIAKTFGLAKPAGALVSEVTPTGPAEKAGIKSGDIILAFDNKPVREMRNLPRIVAETDISKDVPIVVWRQGKRIDLTANVGELEKAEDDGLLSAHDGNSLDDETQEDPNKGVEISELGLTLNFLTDELRETFGASKDIKGAVVMDADVNSDAASKGIDVGDIIIDINQKPVTSLDMIKSEISNSIEMGKEAVLLLINRQGNIQFVAVKIKKQQEKPAE